MKVFHLIAEFSTVFYRYNLQYYYFHYVLMCSGLCQITIFLSLYPAAQCGTCAVVWRNCVFRTARNAVSNDVPEMTTESRKSERSAANIEKCLCERRLKQWKVGVGVSATGLRFQKLHSEEEFLKVYHYWKRLLPVDRTWLTRWKTILSRICNIWKKFLVVKMKLAFYMNEVSELNAIKRLFGKLEMQSENSAKKILRTEYMVWFACCTNRNTKRRLRQLQLTSFLELVS